MLHGARSHLACATLTAVCLLHCSIEGQTSNPYTLHVYTDVVELAVVAVKQNLQPLPPLQARDFVLSLNDGPSFAPQHARLEGDDPLSVAVVIDRSYERGKKSPDLGTALASLAPASLSPQDRLIAVTFDCTFIRSSPLLPAPTERLQAELANLLHSTLQDPPEKCDSTQVLWNAMIEATKQLAPMPGRKAILVLTDRRIASSSHTWATLRVYADMLGIAVFALRAPGLDGDEEDPLNFVCSMTGGLIQPVPPKQVQVGLAQFVRLLRGRYILDFRRPESSASGFVPLNIHVRKRDALVRSTGVLIPPRSADELASPAHGLRDTSKDPKIGSRHVLTLPQ